MTDRRKRVVIESPLKGDRNLNKLYARVCALDSLVRGEAPYASHLFFDHEDLLDDEVLQHREIGIAAGFAWGEAAELRVFYLDLSESDGMKRGRAEAERLGQPTEDRRLFAKEPWTWLRLPSRHDLTYLRNKLQSQLGDFKRIDQ